MNRSRAGKWSRRAVWAGLLLVATIGCSPLSVMGFVFAKDPKVEAKYPLAFSKDNPKKNKDEVVVLVLPHLVPGSDRSILNAERDLATELAHVLPEMAKANKDKKKIRVLSPTQVDKFKIANPNWKAMNPADVGQKLAADFVLDIELSKMHLYAQNTGRFERIYEGGAEVKVTVYEVGVESNIQDYPHTFRYPKDSLRSGDAIPETEFKKQYFLNLATELAEYHIDHKPADGLDGR
jgi:hypothetical protein